MNAFKRVVLFSLLLLLTVSGGFFVGDHFLQKHIEEAGESHQYFHKMLNLTPAQMEKLVPIEKKFSEQKDFYENQIHQANMALGEIIKREKNYTPEVQATVEKIYTAMGQLQKVTLIHIFDMRELLDDKQARIFDDYVADALHGL